MCNSGVELGDEDAEEDCEDEDEGTVPDVEDEEADNDDELKNSTVLESPTVSSISKASAIAKKMQIYLDCSASDKLKILQKIATPGGYQSNLFLTCEDEDVREAFIISALA